MEDAQQCKKCGRSLQPEQLICECGAEIEASEPELPQIPDLVPPDLELPQLPEVTLPDLELGQPEAPSLNFSSLRRRLEESPSLKKIVLDDLGLIFADGHATRGHSYRPLLAIGKTGEGQDITRMPFGVAQLKDGRIYVIDFMDEGGRARVQLFNETGDLLKTIRQFEVGDEPETLDTPAGIAVDVQGNFYITDMGTSCVKKFSPEGMLLAVLGDEGIEKDQLMAPQDVDLDAEGNLYIADTDNNRILKWDQQGNCLLMVGINELDEDTGWLMAGEGPGEFDGPQGVAVDGMGNILVADSNNHRAQKFSPRGEFLQMIGGEGEEAGEFYYPNHIQVDAKGDIYVSDLSNGHIQKFNAEGHFIYQIILPSRLGSVRDFVVNDEGHILVALRKTHLVFKLEVA